ncbi:predicted protein [Sclerotinia sclerotiorum 1980 UF-70]|uniref:Uncharacterized protein n=1 Tax=Sclerotinia sclerotiorum (strain ATCC 18683 / 1980 / Ss-1) TaxID=665079 RepID=A7F9Y1_SCLS1|nr:predicted protein [Sclerotinia sclerotiorum 1980 UF-70]EDO00542.1 predicted protein [Sclerotinia sclerotiorum 1980 UF-70]
MDFLRVFLDGNSKGKKWVEIGAEKDSNFEGSVILRGEYLGYLVHF